MKIKLIVAAIGIILQLPCWAQCNNDLVQIAIAQSGKDALFIREFKVKLKKGTLRNPIPAARYNVYMKEGSQYRFNIETDRSVPVPATLQLFSNGKCVGSTYDEITNTDRKTFDYQSPQTGNYQVMVTFRNGDPGCAVGVMSLLETQAIVSDSVKAEESASMETIYLNVENPLSVITDKEPTDTIILEVDNGLVYNRFGNYYLRPDNEGIATLKVFIRDANRRLKEEARSDFLVRRIPVPVANVQGMQGGIISRSTVQLAENLNIDSPVDFEKYGYRVVDFVVRIGPLDEKRVNNSGKKFNSTLKLLLADLPEDSRIVFESIRVKKPDGQVITLEPLAFIVR